MFTCPSVKREVSGELVELRMDFDAIALAEQVTGKNLLDDKIWLDMDSSTMTVLYWACRLPFDSKLTIKDVRRAGFKDAAAMIKAVRAAWRAASDLPEEDPLPTNGSKSPDLAVDSAQ